jgi:hypothetical protein
MLLYVYLIVWLQARDFRKLRYKTVYVGIATDMETGDLCCNNFLFAHFLFPHSVLWILIEAIASESVFQRITDKALCAF